MIKWNKAETSLINLGWQADGGWNILDITAQYLLNTEKLAELAASGEKGFWEKINLIDSPLLAYAITLQNKVYRLITPYKALDESLQEVQADVHAHFEAFLEDLK